MNKRYWLVGVLTLLVAIVALGVMTTAAQAAKPEGKDGAVSADAPPDPEWEMAREQALARLARLEAKMALMFDGGISERRLEMELFDFARRHGLKIRHRDWFYEMRDRRFNNGYRINGNVTVQGQGQGTQQGTGTGTQQGAGAGTQQGTGGGAVQGGVVIGGNLAGVGKDHAPMRLGRCGELVAQGNSVLSGLAKRNGVSYGDVAGRLCEGNQLSDIRLGYWISRRAGIPADSVFADKASGKSWQAILDSYDLKFDNWR